MGVGAFVEGPLLTPITGYCENTVVPDAGRFTMMLPLPAWAPLLTPKMKPFALPTLNV